MAERGITQNHIEEALRNIVTTFRTRQDSTCVEGKVADGRILRMYVLGDLPEDDARVAIIKTVAWKEV